MKRIAIFGTHGAAKTTLVYKLAAFYKMEDKNVTVIHETARQSPFPINQDTVYQTTLFVVASQLQKELKAEAEGFEIAISDRTPSDAFIYINHLKRNNNLTKSLELFCLEWIRKYDVLVYLEPTPGYVPTEDGVRAVNVEYQNSIRDDFRQLVKTFEQKYQNSINIIKAESKQIFDEKQINDLLDEINRGVYGKTRDVNLV
ncbi:MAG: AAA family ATPase [Parachlamydiales bacterium]|nr:AAA family ATPase [Parachlamydiales bacterium]